MTQSELRNQIDKVWTEFWTGGITNPLTVIEQITYLLFCRMLDESESQKELQAKRSGKPLQNRFFSDEQQHLRWSHFRHIKGEELLILLRDEVFPFLRALSTRQQETNRKQAFAVGKLMKDAQLLIVKPTLLSTAITLIDAMDMDDTDTKGDVYEYLLSKLQTAGINGQFRTPRHILETMVQILDPKPTDTIADPACGTAGFLVKSMEYLRQKYTSPEAVFTNDKGHKVYSGDLLTPYHAHMKESMFFGFDFDLTMLRLSAMNMLLHGIEGQCIYYQDTLSDGFKLNYPKQFQGFFDIILANPPFKGNLDVDDIADELLKKVKSTKTELLFLVRMLGMLKLGGRCAVIVPDGVLFGASKAHVALRSLILDNNQLDGVISLPSGVFKPYAGVSTAILLFTKGGESKDVFFFDVQADGYSLDDKRNKIEADDLPALLKAWKNRDAATMTDRKSKAFFVTAEEIREQKYDLSLSKYKQLDPVIEVYDPPLVILERMEKLEKEIATNIVELRGML